MEFLKHWWKELTTGGTTALFALIFREALIEITKGFAVKLGETLEKIGVKLNKRKKTTRREDNVLIGRLQQKVTDLLSWKKSITKELRSVRDQFENCKTERQECRSDLVNIASRVAVLERRKA